MTRRWHWTAALGLIGLLAAAPIAAGADVTAPANGAVVSSRPAFAFDFSRGNASIELSREPETKTAGDDIGAFVDTAATEFFIIGGEYDDAPYILTPGYPDRLHAGRYYWHAKLDDYADDSAANPRPAWGPIRTLTVKDEPPLIEGWIVRVERLRARGRCRTRLRVSGKFAWSDNEPNPEGRYAVRLTSGRRMIARVTGTISAFGGRFGEVACVRRRVTGRRVTASGAIRDEARQIAVARSRRVTIRRVTIRR